LGLPESSSLLVVFAQFGTREDTDDQTNKPKKQILTIIIIYHYLPYAFINKYI